MTSVGSQATGGLVELRGVVICGTAAPTDTVRIGGVVLDTGVPIIGVPGLVTEIFDGERWRVVEVRHAPDPARPDTGRLRELAALEATPLDALASPCPVAGTSAADAEEEPREADLAERFEYLAQAAASPQSRLTSRPDVVALQRARRISSRGLTWLAAHPAAWSGRRGSTIIPERVLSEQPQLLYDIYENRLLATLVDRVLRHLDTRIRTLGQQQDTVDELLLSRDASWSVQARVATLASEAWGERADDVALHQAIQERLRALRDRRRRVGALRLRPGVAHVPRSGRTVRALRQTNIIRGDDRYQQVAQLWKAFSTQEPDTPRQQVSRQLDAFTGHERFVRLLVLRALADCLDDADVTVSNANVLRISALGASPLHIASLFAAAVPADLGPELGVQLEPTLIVLQPAGDTPSAAPWRSRGQRLTVVAEAPSHLGAVETIGALIREHVLGARYSALPPTVRIPRELLSELAAAGLRTDTRDALGADADVYILAAPAPDAIESLQVAWLPNGLRGARRQTRERRWVELESALTAAAAAFALAAPCPMPQCRGKGSVTARADRMLFECGECETRWGMQRCPSGHPVPFALGTSAAEAIEILEAPVDHAYVYAGMELVLPVGFAAGRLGTPCPVCGVWTILPVGSRG